MFVNSLFISSGSRSRIRIQHFRLNTDPNPDPIRIRIQGFKDQKIKKFFGTKTTIYLSPGSARNKFFTYYFCGSDPDLGGPETYGSYADPDLPHWCVYTG
jgi:hypothetical protein